MVRIIFKDLQVEQITKSSGVFSGENQQVRWQSVNKMNQGFGELSGNKNVSKNHIHTIIDPDTKDN